MFDYCAKSTKSPSKKSSKSPSKKSSKSPSKSPTAKSGKCKSSKAPTAAPVAPTPPVSVVEPAAQPEAETILESATTTTTTLVETPEVRAASTTYETFLCFSFSYMSLTSNSPFYL